MTALVFLSTFGACFLLVACKAFQQINVAWGHYWLIFPTGLVFACAEVHVVHLMAERGFGAVVLPVWLGSSAGCVCAMRFHKWVTTRRSGRNDG